MEVREERTAGPSSFEARKSAHLRMTGDSLDMHFDFIISRAELAFPLSLFYHDAIHIVTSQPHQVLP
jgi:hypothetical protein